MKIEKKRRVVITGLGTVNPTGNTVAESWAAVKAGRCAVGPITAFDTTDFKVKLAAEVKDFDPAERIDRREARKMARFTQFAVAAADEAIGYINAHGTSTHLNDSCETAAIKSVFGSHAYELAVSSTKSKTGHLLGGAGGVEGVFTALALHDAFLPATVNLQEPDPELDLDYIPNQGRALQVDYAMSDSLGFGGHNACVVFKRWEE